MAGRRPRLRISLAAASLHSNASRQRECDWVNFENAVEALSSLTLGHMTLLKVSYGKSAMKKTIGEQSTTDVQAIALKAFSRIADAWSLTGREAAALADMSESTWKRARKPGFAGGVSRDQGSRLSALIGIYKSLEIYFDKPIAGQWVKLKNHGPEFNGRRPIDAMIDGGLPKILLVRKYVDALSGGV